MTHDLMVRFDDRYSEIQEYLAFLIAVDHTVQSGLPVLSGGAGTVITPRQQRILYSSVYLQLYNLVESTVTSCLDFVSKETIASSRISPADLSAEMRKEWVKYIARTNTDQGADGRLTDALKLCDQLVAALPVQDFTIEKGGGGNWHDDEIQKIATRIGCTLSVENSIYQRVRRPIRNDKGAMKLVVSLRNELAHGSISFVDCGQFDTAADLADIADRVANYMREVVSAFVQYILEQEYLDPTKRVAPPPLHA